MPGCAKEPEPLSAEELVALAKPMIEANPPPDGYRPVVVQRPLPREIPNNIPFLVYIPERMMRGLFHYSFYRTDGVCIFNALNDDIPVTMQNLFDAGMFKGAFERDSYIILVVQADMGANDMDLVEVEELFDMSSLFPEEEKGIVENHDITVEGANGVLELEHREPGFTEVFMRFSPGIGKARIEHDDWILIFIVNGTEKAKSDEEWATAAEEAKTVVESVRLLRR